MTGSITLYSANNAAKSSVLRWGVVLWWFLFCLLVAPKPARAADSSISISSATMQVLEDRYVVNANCSVQLNPMLEDVLQKGVPLYFLAEFELVKPRWYWAYRQMASWFDSTARQEYRLSYNALTRKYRVARGGLQQNFTSLPQALAAMGNISNWAVMEVNLLSKGRQYEGRLRLSLNVAQLPKPFQINVIGSSEWDLSSDWKSVPFLGAGAE